MSGKMHVKKDDMCLVLSGVDRNTKARVLEVIPKKRMVILEGVNIITRHTKPRRQGEIGGLVKKEAPIHASKVMNICGKCHKPTRIGRKVLENGNKVRYCKRCNETFND